MIVAKTHNARAIHSHGTDFTFLPGGVGGGFATGSTAADATVVGGAGDPLAAARGPNSCTICDLPHLERRCLIVNKERVCALGDQHAV